MKILNIPFLFLFAFAIGCSVTKDVDKNNVKVSDVKEEAAPNPHAELEKTLIRLTHERDLNKITRELGNFDIDQINLQTAKGSPVMESLLEIGDQERLSIFIAAGLSIYQKQTQQILEVIHKNEVSAAINHLNRYNEKYPKKDMSSDNSVGIKLFMAQRHFENLNIIEKSLEKNDISEAVLLTKDQRVNCETLSKSLILRSHVSERKSVPQIYELLSRLNCGNSLSESDTKILYSIEMQKLFQEKFRNKELLKFFFESKNLKDPMLTLSESGIRLSPYKLFVIALSCSYNENESDPCSDPDNSSQCTTDTKEKYDNCVKKSGFPNTKFDLTYSKGELRIASLETFSVVTGEAVNNFPVQVTSFMHGFADSEKEWKFSLNVLLTGWFLEAL